MPSNAERIIEIKEFPIHQIQNSCTWIVVGPPGTGKTTFMMDLCYIHKHKYPVVRIWCGTEDTQGAYAKRVKSLYVSNEYREDEHERCIIRQKICKADGCKNVSAIYLMDDCNTDRKVFRSKLP